jgi:hypothetical protein
MKNERKKAQQRMYAKKHYDEHKEDILSRQKEYRVRNPARRKEYEKEYRDQNFEKIQQYAKNYYTTNASRLSEYQRNYRAQHKNYFYDYQKQYREKHAAKIADYQREYRQKRKEVRMQAAPASATVAAGASAPSASAAP